jgi:hypothetical protein
LLAAAAISAVTAAHAAAAPESTALIRPGQGIWKIGLGMTEAELRRSAGRPRIVVPRGTSFGFRTVEFQYGLADYTAELYGRPGRLRVVRATTILGSERTRAGIGVGTREQRLRRAYPRLRCTALRWAVVAGTRVLRTNGRTCTLAATNGRRTVFSTAVYPFAANYGVTPEDFVRKAVVTEVAVE